jgi:hypothetical protein
MEEIVNKPMQFYARCPVTKVTDTDPAVVYHVLTKKDSVWKQGGTK